MAEANSIRSHVPPEYNKANFTPAYFPPYVASDSSPEYFTRTVFTLLACAFNEALFNPEFACVVPLINTPAVDQDGALKLAASYPPTTASSG